MIPTITIQSEIKRLIAEGKMVLDGNGNPQVVLDSEPKKQPNGMYNLLDVITNL